MNDLIYEVKRAVKSWWLSIVIGILALIVGIWSLFTPFETFAVLTLLFVIIFLVQGILEIIFSISNRQTLHGWGWTLALGIVDVIFSIILMMNMALTPLVFSYVIAFWLLFRSIWGISVAIDFRGFKDSGWGWLLAFSILGVLLSCIMFFMPGLAATFAIYLVGFALITYGIFRIYLGVRLKNLGKNVRDIKSELKEY